MERRLIQTTALDTPLMIRGTPRSIMTQKTSTVPHCGICVLDSQENHLESLETTLMIRMTHKFGNPCNAEFGLNLRERVQEVRFTSRMGSNHEPVRSRFKLHTPILSHRPTHTHLHSIEYRLHSMQKAAGSTWIRVDLAASSHRTSFLKSKAKLSACIRVQPYTLRPSLPQGTLFAGTWYGFLLYRSTTVLPYTGSVIPPIMAGKYAS
jgi:hypothetical protein